MSKRGRTAPVSTRPTKRAKPTLQRQNAMIIRSLEFKNYDDQTSAYIVAAQATSVFKSIFSPDQGTSPTEHVGRSMKVVSLEYNLTSTFAATTVGASPIRLAIVYDRQPNAALPAATDVWQVDNIGTMKNLNNKKRFKILVDEKNNGISDAGPKSVYIHGYRKFRKPLETEFNNVNGGTIADITTGSYIAFVWQSGALITAAPTTTLYTRFRTLDA